jgi:hypothetical protein
VVFTVYNTIGQKTDTFDYEYGLAVFNSEGNEVTNGASGTTATPSRSSITTSAVQASTASNAG